MKSQLVSAGGLMVAAIVFGAAITAHAQTEIPRLTLPTSSDVSGNGTITGRVTLPSGNTLNGRVRITLSTLKDPGMLLYTDNNGEFFFGNLPAGNYALEAVGDAKLYEPTTEQVRLPRGARVSVTITLREKSGSTKAPAGNVVSVGEFDRDVPPAAKKQYEKGVRLANDGKLAEALESFKQALALYPRYLRAHNDLGAQFLKLRRMDEAVEEFEIAIEIDPKAFNPRLNMGIARVEQRRFSEAMSPLNEAVAIDNSSAAAHLYIGIASVEIDDLVTAERELKTALSMGDSAGFSVVHYYLAQVHLKNGEREVAIAELKTFLEKSPNNELAPRAKKILEGLAQ